MRGKWVFLAILLFGCQDDQFQQGLYNYQVERLLSGGDSKTWTLVSTNNDGVVSNPALCSDTLRLLISTAATDSIHVARLTPEIDCIAFVSEDLGKANASGNLAFTDSIIFDSGEVWIITEITSENLSFTTRLQSESWQSK